MSSSANPVARAILLRQEDREQEDLLSAQIAIAEALADSDEPLSNRDLRYAAHLSERQVNSALRRLRDRDIVEQLDNPDDQRVPLYRLRSPVPDGTDRGQITPVGAGVLMLAVGVLLLAAITIGVVA